MEQFNIRIADVIQLLILLAAIVTIVNSYGSRIKALEKEGTEQKDRCSKAMGQVVTQTLLNAKMETLTSEMMHLNDGQKALFKKMDDVYKLLIDYAKGQ